MPQDTISVYNPQGALGDIPSEDLGKALAAGYKLASKETNVAPDPVAQSRYNVEGIIEGGPEAKAQTEQAKLNDTIQAAGGIKGVPIGPPPSAGLAAISAAGGIEKFLQQKSQGAGTLDAAKSGLIAGGTTAGLGAGVGLLGKIIPSAARAGRTLEEIKSKAGDVPIDVSQVGNAALDAQHLAQAGGSLPKVVRDFLRRVTDPEKDPMTYSEARDFYSNATRVSNDEFNRLTPVMKRQLTIFKSALGDSIGQAAGTVGEGQNYVKALLEYHRASELSRLGKTAGKVVAGAAGLGAAGAGYGVAQKLLSKK